MLSRLRTYASFVRVSHSVFALPFALVGALLAARTAPITWARVAWIVACMVTARSAAMGFNRLADARHDARNPRTAGRELPAGRMSRGEAAAFVGVSAAAFLISAWQLGPVCAALAPVALAIVFWYSLAKRVTSYAQLFLGLAMAVAPVGGWIAAGGGWGAEPWLLGVAIGLWVGGFDVLYACQDLEVDRREGMKSIPVRFGIARSLLISRGMHVVTVVCLAAIAWVAPLGPIYLAGVAGVAVLLVWEQSLVKADDLSQVKRAFDLNGWVGILYLVTTAISVYGDGSVFHSFAPLGDRGRSTSVPQMSETVENRPVPMHVVVGITGASGAVYGVRTLGALLAEGCRLDVIFSDYGRRLLLDELGPDAKVDRLPELLEQRYGAAVRRGELIMHSNRDSGAAPASGSHRAEAMVIVPCSMKTLAGVALGLSRNLIERAADVMLKERRRLVLVPRETPMSLPALKNMVAAAEAGATILPAMPAFYQMPKSIDDLADFMAGKILNSLGLEQSLFTPWKGD